MKLLHSSVLKSPFGIASIIAGLSLFALGFALISQYGFDLFPCDLCILQRWPYLAAIILAVGMVLLRKNRRIVIATGISSILAFFTTAGIALYHTGVEQGWIKGPTGCTQSGEIAGNMEELKAQIMSSPLISCEDTLFEFLGLSMAAWNAVYAVAGAVLIGILLRNYAGKENTKSKVRAASR
jgi:disulfide bond formation protein DsbB